MLPTPDTSHVSYNSVYEPAEDSFLLLDTLSCKAETGWLHERFKSHTPLVCEIGTGSGVVIAFMSANAEVIFGVPVVALGLDVNWKACKATEETARKAIVQQESRSTYSSSICSDLCSALRKEVVDVLIFNPPYVPSEELPVLPHLKEKLDLFETESHLLALSYAGGADGMETTDRLLGQLPDVLSPNGVAYILLCAQNKPELVKHRMRNLPSGPWFAETVGSSGKKAGWEKLQIVKIWREQALESLES